MNKSLQNNRTVVIYDMRAEFTDAGQAGFDAVRISAPSKAEFMGLFRAVVLDVWKKRLALAGTVRDGMEARLAALQHREGQLDEAFVYEKKIDSGTYERQRDRLREDIALCRIELEDARVEEIDVEGLLGFAEHVLSAASRLWLEASADGKQRLQRALFPEGLRFRDGRFGTAVTCLAFTQLAGVCGDESRMASPTGFEPVF